MAEASSLPGPGGLTRSESGWGDHYVGRADDLIAAGLITADQLPGQIGQNKIMRTFYAGVQVGKGSNRPRDEHYLSIRRKGREFEVIKGVSYQVQKERAAARKSQRDADLAAQRAARHEEEKREYASKQTPADYREKCLLAIDMVRWRLDGSEGHCPFTFSSDARAEIEAVLRQLEALFQRSQVLPLRPEKARAGHLRLAWSAA